MSESIKESREHYFSSLMRASLGGDGEAYKELLLSLRKILMLYSRGFLARMGKNDEATAEDLVQEILIAIHNKRHTYDVDLPFLSWVFAIARYKLVDFGRRERRRPIAQMPLDLETVAAAPDPQDPMAARDLEEILQSLPEGARRALELVKLEGLTLIEAADHLNMSTSAVKVSIHRSLKKLQKLWSTGKNDDN